MPSLLLVVFVLQLVIHIINTVGAPVIDEFLWVLYNKLPTPTSRDVQKQITLRRELVRLKTQLNATSAQSEFAKWAKLRREHDKKMAEYDEKTNGMKEFKSKFDRAVSLTRYISTNGLRLFLQFWYTKHPMYWIPRGWAPSYVEWILSFPRAPTGSVSIQIWGIACGTVVRIMGAAIVAGIVLAREGAGSSAKRKEEAFGNRASGGGDSGGESQVKKEL